MMDDPFPVFVGWDQREDDAYQVCRKSLIRHSSVPLYVRKLDRRNLSWPGDQGIFTRRWPPSKGQMVDRADGKPFRSAELRVGKGGVSTSRYRLTPII